MRADNHGEGGILSGYLCDDHRLAGDHFRRVLADATGYPTRLPAADERSKDIVERVETEPPFRIPGTAVVLGRMTKGVPLALTHNLKLNHVLHERVLLVAGDNHRNSSGSRRRAGRGDPDFRGYDAR